MPTQKFMNLHTDKQRAILESMRDEFLHIPYADITVSKIIRGAGISRASFYTYFSGKDDLFICMLHQMKEDLKHKLLKIFKEEHGIYYNSMKRMFLMLEDDVGQDYCRIYQQLMNGEGCRQLAVRMEDEILDGNLWIDDGKPYYETIDSSLYPGLSAETLAYAVDMGLLVITKAVLLYLNGHSGIKDMEEAAMQQLFILDKGIRA